MAAGAVIGGIVGAAAGDSIAEAGESDPVCRPLEVELRHHPVLLLGT
jgi:hypothetical protein